MSTAVEMQGTCLLCDQETIWYVCEGWVFHSIARHWRCRECGCATQPHLFLPPPAMALLREQLANRNDVIEVEV